MNNRKYSLAGGLTSDDLNKIYQDALDLLETVGVEVNHRDLQALLSEKPGVKINGKRVCLEPALVEKYRLIIQKENREYQQNKPGAGSFSMVPSFLCLNVLDMDKKDIRRATLADLKNAVKLCDYYKMEGVIPVHPHDVAADLRQAASLKVALENSAGIGGWMPTSTDSYNEKEIACIFEMNSIMGRKPPYIALEIPVSPMKIDVAALNIMLRMQKHNKKWLKGIAVGGGAIPMPGATAPIVVLPALTQGLAEALSAAIIPKLIDDDVSVYCSFGMFPFDMKYMSSVGGSPEDLLLRLMARQVQEFALGYIHGGSFSCMGKMPDAQTAAEKMANILMDALQGANLFSAAGSLSLDEVFSFEQLVIDKEILGYVERVTKGMQIENEYITGDLIGEGIQNKGSYLDHQSTLNYRDFFWMPSLFTHSNLGQWRNEGMRSIIDNAGDIARKILAEHHFTIESDKQHELDKTYESYKRIKEE